MSPAFKKPALGIELPFFILASMSWMLAISLTIDSSDFSAEKLISLIPFIAVAIFSAFLMLRISGYFDVIRLFPRRSDVILLAVSISLGGIFACLINSFLMKKFNTELLNASISLPPLSLVVFGLHHIFVALKIKSQGVQKIVIDLTPQERALVIQDLAGWGFLNRLEILSREDLKQELVGHNPRSISLVIISPRTAQCFEDDETILEAHLAGISIVDYRRVCARLSGRIRLTHTNVWDYVLSATPQTVLIRLYSSVKNLSEPLIAAILAALLCPLMFLIAVAIRLSSSGPVLFRQTRVGHKQKPFELIKFRTMRFDTEASLEARWCHDNDSRVTNIGHFLRKTRLDELPQLWNVLRGEMSFIGPRPEQPAIEHSLRMQIPAFALRTLVKPGITGWAQVCAGYAASIEESRIKLEYDLFYMQNMSPRLDMIVIFKTFQTAIRGDKKLKRTVVVEMPNSITGYKSPLLKQSDHIASSAGR